jgi:hypothetical protein
MHYAILFLALWLSATLPLPVRALDRTQLAVIVNTSDPLSVQIGDYYAAKRRISFQNLIKVSFAPGKSDMNRSEFEAIKRQVDRQSQASIQAYALTWVSPYRVDCMSITTAFTFGFDTAFCAETCKLTRVSPYFNSPVRLPFTQLGIRPTMSIAAASIIAKVTRDRLMGCVGAAHPGYGFERHMGYSVPEHFAALSRLGPCVHHRRRFAPVAALLGLPETAAEVDETAQLSL